MPSHSEMLFAPQELSGNSELEGEGVFKGLFIVPALMMINESNILTGPFEPSPDEIRLIIIGVGVVVSFAAVGASRAAISAYDKLEREFNFLKYDETSSDIVTPRDK